MVLEEEGIAMLGRIAVIIARQVFDESSVGSSMLALHK